MEPQERQIQLRETLWLCALISLGLLLRLIYISQPFVDEWSWRQSDMAMIAENFYRYGFNIFYPQINWAGNSPGYVGTEFPLLNFLASLLYIVFGVHEWIGRSLSVLFFVVSVPFLYWLVRRISNERSALIAVAVYDLAPLGIFASRSFMPDMASLSLSIMALYFFTRWLDIPVNRKFFIAATVTTSLAILIKLPAIIIGVPLLYLCWEKYGKQTLAKREFWVFACCSLFLPLAWYSHAYLISLTYSPYHMFGSGGIKIMDFDFYLGVLHKVATSSLTPVVFSLMLLGLLLPSRATYGRVFQWWLVAVLCFMVIAGNGFRHQWYQLPLVPVAAAFAGLACDFALRKITKVTSSRLIVALAGLLPLVALVWLSYIYAKPLYTPWAIPLMKAGIEINRIAPPDALVIAVGHGSGDPTALYYSKRNGWHFPQATMPAFEAYPADFQKALEPYVRDLERPIIELEKLRKKGAGYIFFTRYLWRSDHYLDLKPYLDSLYRRVRDTDEFVIYDLTVRRTDLKL